MKKGYMLSASVAAFVLLGIILLLPGLEGCVGDRGLTVAGLPVTVRGAAGSLIGLAANWNLGHEAANEYELRYREGGGVEVYEYSAGRNEPGVTTGYSADGQLLYREEYCKGLNGYERRCWEYYGGVEIHYWRYCAGGWLREEILYYDNGCKKEHFEYDEMGNAVRHRRYGRNGRVLN